MTAPTFAKQREAWARVPIDGIGYRPVSELAEQPDAQLRATADAMARERYEGWRNHLGRWRDILGLDVRTEDLVVDYGCGLGIDSRELAYVGARILLADVNLATAKLAARIHGASGVEPVGVRTIGSNQRLNARTGLFDVFLCSGVLHHVPQPHVVMAEAHRLLRAGGQVRLMLYSDRGWRNYVGTEPPDDVASDPDFLRFVRTFDEVGEWADWYDAARLADRFGDLFDITRFEYLGDDDRYCGAVLTKREAT